MLPKLLVKQMSSKSAKEIYQITWLVQICSLIWLSKSYCYIRYTSLATQKIQKQRAERLVVGTLATWRQAFRPQRVQQMQIKHFAH